MGPTGVDTIILSGGVENNPSPPFGLTDHDIAITGGTGRFLGAQGHSVASAGDRAVFVICEWACLAAPTLCLHYTLSLATCMKPACRAACQVGLNCQVSGMHPECTLHPACNTDVPKYRSF